MDLSTATGAFGALAQRTRLEAFRLLLESGPDGMPAGAISAALDIPHNTLSSHLSILARADLVTSTRRGRSVIYRVNLEGVQALLEFLMQDCCQGSPEVCASVLGSILPEYADRD